MQNLPRLNGLVWLTNIETAEPVGVPLSRLLLVEQKRPQDGGSVGIYLEHGKEVHVAESLKRVAELIAAAADMRPDDLSDSRIMQAGALRPLADDAEVVAQPRLA